MRLFSIIQWHHVALMIIGVSAAMVLSGWTTLNISPHKSQNQLPLIPGTKVIARHSSPLGIFSVVGSNNVPIRHAPGICLNATTEPPEQLAGFTDADNMTAITRYDGIPETLNYRDQTTSALPYHLMPLSNILILGAGTGSDIMQANYHAIRHIDAVELIAQIIDLVKDKYADFAGHIYNSANLNLYTDEDRGFVATTSENLISIRRAIHY